MVERGHEDNEPRVCPECGSREWTDVEPERIDSPPGIHPPAFPGMRACKRCKTIVQWGP